MTDRLPFPPEFPPFDAIASDPVERKEHLADCFGAVLFWTRDFVLRNAENAVQDEEVRDSMGTIRRKPYDAIAGLNEEQRAAALKLAEVVVHNFGHMLSWHFTGIGNDLRVNDDLAMRLKLIVEIVEVMTGEIAASETINRGGKRAFGDNWGRWLNLFR